MNDRPAISVIVAVYKAERYLRKCLDSLRAQTFKDFEVLLVDDGSPDGSGAICDEYAATDSRFRVFHKENGGVSSARQYGTDHARGEYTIHADPDDWVEPDMLAQLYAKAKAEDADMVICDYFYEKNNAQTIINQHTNGISSLDNISNLFRSKFSGSLWNKLIRRSLFKQYNIKFPIGINLGEDYLVVLQLLLNDIRVFAINKPLYHYVSKKNSITQTRDYKLALQQIDFVNQAESIVRKYQPSVEDIVYLKIMVKRDLFIHDSYPPELYKKLYPEALGKVFSADYNIAEKVLLFLSQYSYKFARFLCKISSAVINLIKAIVR